MPNQRSTPAEAGHLVRHIPLTLIKREGAAADPNLLTISASSEEPVMRYGWSEILSHEPGAVDLTRLAALGALLVNHNPDQRAAAIRDPRLEGKRLLIDAVFGSGAFPQQIRQEVADGLLRGASVRYEVTKWEIDEEKQIARAVQWTPFEVSLTPIPADPSVGVGRDHPLSESGWRSLINPGAALATHQQHGDPMGFDQWCRARGIDPATLTDAKKAELTAEFQRSIAPTPPPPPPPPAHDENARAAEMAALRARTAKAELHLELNTLARSHGIDLSAEDLKTIEARDKGLELILSRKATATATVPVQPVGAVRVGQEHIEKQRDALSASILHQAGFQTPEIATALVGNPYRGLGFLDSARRFAAMQNLRAMDWNRQDLAFFVLGRPEAMQARDANVVSGMFTNFVQANILTKAVGLGFEMSARSIKYRQIVSRRTVPDFKQNRIGGLGMGNLTKTVEDVALPELTKAEGYYNSTLNMWGGTLSLTFQALVGDDMGEFMRGLRQAGMIAEKTIDRRVFQKLMMGTSAVETTSTWTSNTTSGGTIAYTTADTAAAARQNIGKVRAAMGAKIGLDGNPLGTVPVFMIVPPTQEHGALSLVTPAGGAPVGKALSLEIVSSAWLEATALIGYSTTSYYLLADPNEVTGLVLSMLPGYESPQVTEYDAGAVTARKWKIWLPFEADLFYVTNAAATAIVPAAQQATT